MFKIDLSLQDIVLTIINQTGFFIYQNYYFSSRLFVGVTL